MGIAKGTGMSSGARPQPTALQRHWLSELGVDRYFIDHLCRDDTFVEQNDKAGDQGDPATPAARILPAKPVLDKASPPTVPRIDAKAARHQAPPSSPQPVAAQAPAPAETLAGLQQQVSQCQACDLYQARARTVFAAGPDHHPDFMLVGEAPTTDDDRVGRPFQGRAGKLLYAMLQAAGIDVEKQVYMTQLVKCRPLGNRPPSPEEIQSCSAYLRRQIALVKPGRLVALGQLAAQALTGQSQPLDEQHGKIFTYSCESGSAIQVVVTHNPTALLSRPQHKLQVWRDLLYLRQS